MMRHATKAAILAALLAPTGALRAENAPLAPSGKWVLNYDTDRCVLSRQFGDAQDPAFLQFVRYSPGDDFMLNIVGRRFFTQANLTDVRLRFGDGAPPMKQPAMTGKMGGLPALFTTGRLDNAEDATDSTLPPPRIPAAVEAAVSRVHVGLGGRRWTFMLGPMDKPMAALRACEADLVRQWGLDPAVQDALAARPTPQGSPARWLTSSDYPTAKLMSGEQAIIAFRLMVGPDGRPTGCSVQSNIARDATFAQTTCAALMRRARFTPARTTTGEAMASYFTNRVRWVIP